MKKLTMIFAVLAMTAGAAAFASNPDDVSKTVKVSFLKNFSEAKNVSWKTADDFSFASFELNGKMVDAAYNEEGELLGTSRDLDLSEVPLSVSQALKSGYGGYNIKSTVTEVIFEGETFYYATAVGATRVLKLKCFSDGDILVEKRTKK